MTQRSLMNPRRNRWQRALAGLLCLAVPAPSWANITNTAAVAYTDAGGNPKNQLSNTVIVTTPVPPTLTQQPLNQTVTAGQTAGFVVVANGSAPFVYQWQRSNDGGNTWTNVGTNSISYVTPATTLSDNGAQFRCLVSNGMLPDAASNAAILTVNPVLAVAAPTFTPPTGTTFTTSLQVTMQSTSAGAFIYYTLDGSNPTLSSPLYTGPIQINVTTTVNAFAYVSGNGQSGIVTAVYTNSSNNLVTPDLNGLPSTAKLSDSLSMASYPTPNVSFWWTFTPYGGPVTYAAAPAAVSIKVAGAGVAAFPSLGLRTSALANYGLTVGSYQVTVYAFDNNNPTIKSNTSAPRTITLVASDFSQLRVFPNPWRIDKHGASNPFITFDHLPLGSTIKILTVSGHHVKTVKPGADPSTATWDLKTDNGDRVASGIYIYLISTGDSNGYGGGSGDKTRGKIVIIQ